jgi:hypothetical protein
VPQHLFEHARPPGGRLVIQAELLATASGRFLKARAEDGQEPAHLICSGEMKRPAHQPTPHDLARPGESAFHVVGSYAETPGPHGKRGGPGVLGLDASNPVHHLGYGCVGFGVRGELLRVQTQLADLIGGEGAGQSKNKPVSRKREPKNRKASSLT